MKCEIEKNVTVKLELTDEEAQRLKCAIQNPITADESMYDRTMRAKFFGAISSYESGE